MHALIEHVIIKHVTTLCRQGHSNFKKACMASGVAMELECLQFWIYELMNAWTRHWFNSIPLTQYFLTRLLHGIKPIAKVTQTRNDVAAPSQFRA